MSEGVTITMGMTLRPEAVEGFISSLTVMLQDTAKQPGFRSIRVVRHAEDPNRLLFVEAWDSAEAYQAYIAWRTKRGDMDAVAQILAAPPQLDIWPSIVAAA